MALQEGYNTTHPSFFNDNSFTYLKVKMEYYLMTNIEMWFIVKNDFKLPKDEFGEPLDFGKQTSDTKKKVQENAKDTQTLQCGMA